MRGIIHGGFRGLSAPAARQAWADFFAAMGQARPEYVFILPWALPEKSHANTLNAFMRRAAAFWDFAPELRLCPTAASFIKALDTSIDTQILCYLPGGILSENCLREMAAFKASGFPEQAILAGYSAGAYALMDWYYNPRRKEIVPGGGVFHGAVCCHGDTTRHGVFGQLTTKKHRPTYFLPDGAFREVRA